VKPPEEMSDAELLAWGGKRPRRPRPWQRSWWTWPRIVGLLIVIAFVVLVAVAIAIEQAKLPV
jgi:hypothetical protein